MFIVEYNMKKQLVYRQAVIRQKLIFHSFLLSWFYNAVGLKKHNNCRKKCLRCRISSFIICLEWRLALLKIFSKDLSCDIVFFILGGKPLKNETEGHGLIVKLKGSSPRAGPRHRATTTTSHFYRKLPHFKTLLCIILDVKFKKFYLKNVLVQLS